MMNLDVLIPGEESLRTVGPTSSANDAIQILRRMRGDMKRPAVLIQCIKALNRFGKYDKTEERLIDYGVPSVLLQAMKRHRHHAELQKQACYLIRAMGGKTFPLFKMGFVGELLNVLDAFQKNADVTSAAYYAVRNVSRCPPAAAAFVDADIGLRINIALVVFQANLDVVQSITGCIWSLGQVKLNRSKLFGDGVVVNVIKGMKNFPDAAKLQEYCCGVLGVFSNRHTLMRLGAAEDLMRTMQNHKDSVKINELAIIALRDFPVMEVNGKQLVKSRLIRTLITAIKRHGSEAKIVENGGMCFWSLARFPEGRNEMAQNGVCDVVLHSIKKHSRDLAVLSTMFGVLSSLSVDEDIAIVLKRLDVSWQVLKSLQVHVRDESVQTKGLCVLRNMFYYDLKTPDAQFITEIGIVANNAAKMFPRNDNILKYRTQINSSIEEVSRANPALAIL